MQRIGWGPDGITGPDREALKRQHKEEVAPQVFAPGGILRDFSRVGGGVSAASGKRA